MRVSDPVKPLAHLNKLIHANNEQDQVSLAVYLVRKPDTQACYAGCT